MNKVYAVKIREGIRIGRQIAYLMNEHGPFDQRVQAMFLHPALRDPLVEQAKYRAMTQMLTRISWEEANRDH